MKKRKMFVTGSLAATLLLTNITPTHAATKIQPRSSLYEPGTGLTLDEVAIDLGINADDFREELRTGKTPKQALEEEGFSPAQIKKIFSYAASHTSKFKKAGSLEEDDYLEE